jgi:hypothetical protein
MMRIVAEEPSCAAAGLMANVVASKTGIADAKCNGAARRNPDLNNSAITLPQKAA